MTIPSDVWDLDPDIIHLNHGSFGATPRAVLDAQSALRDEMERNPQRFMDEVYQPVVETARTALGSFVNADTAGLVFTRNATEGANAVLQSLAAHLTHRSNVVMTSHAYNAVTNTVDLLSNALGFETRKVELPFPVESAHGCVEAVLDAVDADTALVVVDHVTSPTGLVLDVSRVVAECEPAVPVLVDGAHAPGMLPLDLAALGASFYVGNCHKWLCAPKGAGFLWAAERYRTMMRSPTVSHGMNDQYPHSSSPYHSRFDWTGTDDRTAWMVVPHAIETIEALSEDGWPGVMRANRDLALTARASLVERLGLPPAAPADMIGALVSLAPLPCKDPWELKRRIRREHGIEFGLTPWGEDSIVVRVSAQLYNEAGHYERFGDALSDCLS